MKRAFWKYPLMGRIHEFGLYWMEVALAEKALNEKRTVYHFNHGGTLRSDVPFKAFLGELEYYGLRILRHDFPSTFSKDEDITLVSDELAFSISYTPKNGSITMNCYGLTETVVRKLQEVAKARTVRKVTKGHVYVVVQGNEGPYLHEMGKAGETFIPENYLPDTVGVYRHIVEDLNSDDPCGRIIILDGPPGTGKTHMVRALLDEVPKGTFVLVPSNMMSNLGSPSFIRALLREQKKGYPMILVIEDADEAISARDRGNLSEISALLNFSDGIFGAMMDLRIVCTTNADVKDLDEAVMRPGRLCRRLEVGKLDHVQAEAIYKRLGGLQEGRYTRGNIYTLGEIYADARGSGSGGGAPKRAKAKLGFLPEAEESPTPTPPLQPGDTITLPDGEVVEVADAADAAAINKHIGSRAVFDEDDDSDLIDDDPEETPTLSYGHGHPDVSGYADDDEDDDD